MGSTLPAPLQLATAWVSHQSRENFIGGSLASIVIGQYACRVADGSMSIDEAYSRHKQLLKRQHFGREPPNVRKFF